MLSRGALTWVEPEKEAAKMLPQTTESEPVTAAKGAKIAPARPILWMVILRASLKFQMSLLESPLVKMDSREASEKVKRPLSEATLMMRMAAVVGTFKKLRDLAAERVAASTFQT